MSLWKDNTVPESFKDSFAWTKLIPMKLSENFTLEEMTASRIAKNMHLSNIPSETETNNLIRLCQTILQPIRNKLNAPLTVTSGFRCSALNKIVGGSLTSQHLKGEAADIIYQDNKLLWDLIVSMISNQEIMVGQLIDERNLSWIHISLPTPSHKNQILKL